MIGQMAGNYRITEKLGDGGMGTVYKAIDTMLERDVAIKMLRPEIASQQDVVERFRAEAVTLARLGHPAIATLFNFFAENGQLFMVMEFVPGRTLEHVIRESGALPVDYVLRIISKVLDAIEHAHRLGVLHRDLKPANIMLSDSGAVKVMDFGIARILGASRMTRSGNVVGTLEYIAPERIKGQEADIRSDLYSLGIVMYEMLTGSLPFNSDSEYGLMRAQIEQAPPPLTAFGKDVPAEVEAVVLRALAKNPDERFPSAAEFRAALQRGYPSTDFSANQVLKLTRVATPLLHGSVKVAGSRSGDWFADQRGFWSRLGRRNLILAIACTIFAASALSALLWLTSRPKPQIATARPSFSSSGEEGVSNVAAGQAGGPLQQPGSGQDKPDMEDLVKSAKSLPGGVVETSTSADARGARTGGNMRAAEKDESITNAPIPAGPPLSVVELVTLLHAGTPGTRIIRLMELRGVGFLMSPEIAAQITSAGGDRDVIRAASQYAKIATPNPAAVSAVSVGVPPITQPGSDAPSRAGTPEYVAPTSSSARRAAVTSLSQVQRIYIEPMANGLDVHLKAELLRQLGARFQIASSKEEADAVMTGSGETRGGAGNAITGRVLGMTDEATATVRLLGIPGSKLLWIDEAGSRKVLMGVIKKGGPRKIAERLISDLKKAVQ